MPTHEDRSTHGYQTDPHSSLKKNVQEETIKTNEVKIERKKFILTLRENLRGRLLRITEDANGRRNSVIIPATGLVEFSRLVNDMANSSGENAPTA